MIRASDSSYMLDYVARYKFLYVCMYVCMSRALEVSFNEMRCINLRFTYSLMAVNFTASDLRLSV